MCARVRACVCARVRMRTRVCVCALGIEPVTLRLVASVAGRIMSMKNSSDTIGNGTCDPPACS
jgi:hypothetical protein